MFVARRSTIVLAALFATTALFAQQTPGTAAPESNEVHIDQLCRVLTLRKPSAKNPNPVPRYRYNSVVCHFESALNSGHTEQVPTTGAPKHFYVSVSEHEYVLQNVTGHAVVFVVDQTLPKGWRVDSEPKPEKVTDTTATFRVSAQPGQIVRLHVGTRNH